MSGHEERIWQTLRQAPALGRASGQYQWVEGPAMKRPYSAFTLKDAAQLVAARQFTPWQTGVPPRPPSDFLKEDLRRLRAFDLETTESAKTLLIDALFAEIVPNYERLKVWKAVLLETDSLTGVADYVIAPHYVYLATPLLCVA